MAARKIGLSGDTLGARYPRIAEIPFSSERKMMSTVHADAGNAERLLVMTKGAPDVLLSRCTHELVGERTQPLTDARRAEIQAACNGLAEEALRTLAVAFRPLSKTGTEQRRALVLILHNSSERATTPEHHWAPKGLCKT